MIFQFVQLLNLLLGQNGDLHTSYMLDWNEVALVILKNIFLYVEFWVDPFFFFLFNVLQILSQCLLTSVVSDDVSFH